MKRLDEILLEMGLIAEPEIKEALMRQRAHGGKFGSQLMYHRYINEADLVKALEIQFNCRGVTLSTLNIDENVTGLLPKKLALARKVLPFDYDVENNVIKIACENPTDQNLKNELGFAARGKNIELFIAAEIALNTAITKYYLGQDISLEDNLLLEIPDITIESGSTAKIKAEIEPASSEYNEPTILLVTDEVYSTNLMESLLERNRYKVLIADSIEKATEYLGNVIFQTIFIKESISGDYFGFFDRVRKLSPGVDIRFYDSASSLLLQNEPNRLETDLLLKSLRLYVSLVDSQKNNSDDHSSRVGRYASGLCLKLGMSDRDRMVITVAAYVHDIAKNYYEDIDTTDKKILIERSVKIIESFGMPPLVSAVLNSMYKSVENKYTQHLPLEMLGGNILTIVDLFCNSINSDEPLTLDRFEIVKKKLRETTGKLLLSEIVEPFIEMIQNSLLNMQAVSASGQIMIFYDSPAPYPGLEFRLRNEGFRTITENSPDAIIELYSRSTPDILLLVLSGNSDNITGVASKLAAGGIDFGTTPVFLLTEKSHTNASVELLKLGFEDIISLDTNLDLLTMKMKKIMETLSRKKAGNTDDNSPGARGRLADMNLIDLLQALGPSQKTVKITVNEGGPEKQELELYLDRGNIVYAKLGDLNGAEAVYLALTWIDGSWAIVPVDTGEFPPPNNDLSNESIMMEGCRLMDEKLRTGQLM